MFDSAFENKRVFVTGHTGFKGSWLCEWLLQLGAELTGYSSRVNEPPDHFTALDLARRMKHVMGDVRDAAALERAVQEARPDFVFHLAAQSLVRFSYREPAETFATNVLGTVNLLDALRRIERKVSCVIVTSDKCYENREWVHAYREDDALGGYDPYSASKAATEIAVHAYRRSFFTHSGDGGVAIATARAGNVIGGGDWSEDRIVPDCVRDLLRGEPIAVRNPLATRPWQHVLEPLSGYLWLAALLTRDRELARFHLCEASSAAFNFGPLPATIRSVNELVGEFLKHWPGEWRHVDKGSPLHEAGNLSLAIDKAFHLLQWLPVWTFARGVEATATWYRRVARERQDAREQTEADILAYMRDATSSGVRWAVESRT